MRNTSLLIGSIALVALTASSIASTGYSFSRPNTQFSAFQHDQRMCERATYRTKVAYETVTVGGPYRDSNGMATAWPKRPTTTSGKTRFVACMTDKGYRLDAAGYNTGRLWAMQEN